MGQSETGKLGEMAAAEFLRKKGYRILCANYRTRLGEIDLIASDDRFIVFAEVKTRTEGSMQLPREAVDRRKQQRLISTAGLYLAQYETDLQPRFDVIEVTAAAGGPFRVLTFNHLEDAFSV